MFEQRDQPPDDEIEREIDRRRAKEHLHRAEGLGDDLLRRAGDLPDRDEAGQRRRLGHQDQLGRIGRQRMAQRHRRDHPAQQQEARHAAGPRRLDLLGRHCQQAAAKNLRAIAGGADRQRDGGAAERLLQHRPDETMADRMELAEPVIDQEQLDQQRRAAEDEGHSRAPQRTAPGYR